MLEQYKDFFEILFVGMVLVLTMFAFFQVVMKNYFEKPIIEEEFKNEAEIARVAYNAVKFALTKTNLILESNFLNSISWYLLLSLVFIYYYYQQKTNVVYQSILYIFLIVFILRYFYEYKI